MNATGGSVGRHAPRQDDAGDVHAGYGSAGVLRVEETGWPAIGDA